MKIDNKQEFRGYLMMLAGTFFVIIPYIAVRYVFTHYDISVLNAGFWGMAGATIASLPYFLWKNPRKKIVAEWKLNKKTLLIVSLLVSIGYLLWLYGLENGTAGMVGFIKRADVLFGFLLGISLLNEKFSRREFFFAAISIIGFILLSKIEGDISPLAVGAVLLSALFYSLQSYAVKKISSEMDTLSFVFVRISLISIILLAWGLLNRQITLIPFYPLALLAIGQLGGGFLFRIFYFEAHKYLSISQVGFFSLLGPLFVFLASVVILGENITTQKIAGISLILLGIGLFLREKFRLMRAK